MIAIEEADYETYWMCGMAQRELGRADEAIETFVKLLTYNPDDADAYREIGLIHLDLKHDRETAEDYLRQSLSLDAAQPELLQTLKERNVQVDPPQTRESEDGQPPMPQVPESPVPQPPVPQPNVPKPEVPSAPRPRPSQP